MLGQVRVEKKGSLAWIIFDHEKRRNALTAGMWEQIPPAVDDLDSDPAVRVILMRGSGNVAFAAGADISEFSERRIGDAAMAYEQANSRAFEALRGASKPLIASIHGFCVGGGCALALTADLRYAADDAVFAIPAARLGLGYSASGLKNLVDVVGQAAAKEIFFSAKRFRAEEARRMGLVNRVIAKAELDSQVEDLALSIANNAPLTLRAAKLALHDMSREINDRQPEIVEEAIRCCYSSDDYREGVAAFLEKRSPKFRGK